MKIRRSEENLNIIMNDFLTRNNFNIENKSWIIKKSYHGGFGMFANKDIAAGEIVFKDLPIIIGPRAVLSIPLSCVNCYVEKDLRGCSRGCCLPVCSDICENSYKHKKECDVIKQFGGQSNSEICNELFKCLTPIRSLFMSAEDQQVVAHLKSHNSNIHGFEINMLKEKLKFQIGDEEESFMRKICRILDANAFAVPVSCEQQEASLRGLYPLASLVNHSCVPNSLHVFDKNQIMIVRATVPIKRGDEIFHCYSNLMWGTPVRRLHLLTTKHFMCKCARCLDPSEFGSNLSALLCKYCRGPVLSIHSSCVKSNWKCSDCGLVVDGLEIAEKVSVIESILQTLHFGDLNIILHFANVKLSTLVTENHQAKIQLKYKVIWIIGHMENYLWEDVTDELLTLKEMFCKDLIELLQTLRLGKCLLRGLLLYELFCCEREKKRRLNTGGRYHQLEKNEFEVEMVSYLDEASVILKDDVSIPEEIKTKWYC